LLHGGIALRNDHRADFDRDIRGPFGKLNVATWGFGM
jgi:hypothetical protein